jgi:hypothetical protein
MAPKLVVVHAIAKNPPALNVDGKGLRAPGKT